MSHLRVSRLLIQGMRSIEDVELELSEPTVLIGPNGAGKSTIIEACELLRKAGTERPFVGKLFDVHGGSAALLRHGSTLLGLAVGLASRNGLALDYELSLRRSGSWMTVDHERVMAIEPGKSPRTLLERHRTDYTLDAKASEKHSIGEDDLAIAAAAYRSPELEAVRAALSSIEVHPAPDTRSAWTASANQAELGLRSSNIIRPATRVEPDGRNLPNVYHALRNQADWPDTLARIQLALGDRVEAVTTPADPSGGRIGLALRIAGVGEVASFAMSDGQLAYLALIGVLRLQRPIAPSLVAFDEPDLHLHPGLVRRLTSDLEVFGRQTTIVVATHSDALLDALADPARSAVLCDLDERSATRCLRPDPDELQRWLESYRGLGELRSAGYEEAVFPALESP